MFKRREAAFSVHGRLSKEENAGLWSADRNRDGQRNRSGVHTPLSRISPKLILVERSVMAHHSADQGTSEAATSCCALNRPVRSVRLSGAMLTA